MNLDKMLVGSLLMKARKRNGYSQKELAKCLGIAQSYICAIEMGKMKLTDDMREKLTEILGDF